MNKIALIKAEIERLYNDKSYSEDRWDMGYDCACEDIMSFLSTLSEEPDKSLYEAATKFADTQNKNFLNPEIVKNIFIAGAKWQKGQLLKGSPLPEDTALFNKGVEEGKRLMMEGAVEKTVGQLERQCGGNFHFMHGFEVDEMDFPFLNSQECGYGDKVRIIIVKED